MAIHVFNSRKYCRNNNIRGNMMVLSPKDRKNHYRVNQRRLKSYDCMIQFILKQLKFQFFDTFELQTRTTKVQHEYWQRLAMWSGYQYYQQIIATIKGMFIEQGSCEAGAEGQNYTDNDQSMEQSFYMQHHLSPKDKDTALFHPTSYLNQLLQETALSPEKQSAKRLAENKLKSKKLKQKLNLLTEQMQEQSLLKDQRDITSPNKSRLLKLALELEKSFKTQAVDYPLVESLLRQIQKIVEHKREHDLLILRGARIMTTLHALVKRFPSLHRTEAAQSMQSVQLALRLLRTILSLSTSRQVLIVSNQLIAVSTLLSCALMREERRLATCCLHLLNLVISGPNKIELHEIINANIEYMLCSSLLKRLKCCLETSIGQDEPAHSQFILLGFKFYYLVANRCCQKELQRPIYGTPVMDNASRALSSYFDSLIQHLAASVAELVFEREAEGEDRYSQHEAEIPNFKINILVYIFKTLNVIFHVNISYAQKVIECNAFFLKALLIAFNYSKDNLKESHQTKLLCNEIIIFLGNLTFENQNQQNLMRQTGILASFANHPLEYMMEPLKHIFVPAYCSLIHQNHQNMEEAFKQNSVLTLLQYIEKEIGCRNEKKSQDEPCYQLGFGSSKNNHCKTLSRKTSVSSLNSNYSKASIAESLTTQTSTTATVNKSMRLEYKFRPEFWQDLAKELIKIDD